MIFRGSQEPGENSVDKIITPTKHGSLFYVKTLRALWSTDNPYINSKVINMWSHLGMYHISNLIAS